jgi:D-glycero-alpha-D-manno-heptose-7-phosphate kinase
MGNRLFDAARNSQCAARFTGAGGGGCIWALGQTFDIAALKPVWESILSERSEAGLLDFNIDDDGVKVNDRK